MNDQVINGNLFNIPSSNTTQGHRFHTSGLLTIPHANQYETLLETQGFVIPNFEKRQNTIKTSIHALADKLKGQIKPNLDLLDEVTALVEWPVALSGTFNQEFLKIPSEALISAMQEHQKYFALFDSDEQLLPYFITVANIDAVDQQHIIDGNERVIHPRLSDAAFFFNTDKKVALSQRTERLKHIVFQHQLGTLFDKTQRMIALSKHIAAQCHYDPTHIERAALLSKSDLTTDLVGEFAKLQGIAGRYYAQHDGESKDVALALQEHYLPKYAGDALPSSEAGIVLALADRLDTLVGIIGVGLLPTGSKDPFALRRASVSILRLIIEHKIDLDLKELITFAHSLHGESLTNPDAINQSLEYILERLQAWYQDLNIATPLYLSVAAKNIHNPLDFNRRIYAISSFCDIPASRSLAQANKRVSNLLNKTKLTDLSIDTTLFQEDAEKQLHIALNNAINDTAPLIQASNYQQALSRLSELELPINRFFDEVMVMVDDDHIKTNRLALLQALRHCFLNIADISYLAIK